MLKVTQREVNALQGTQLKVFQALTVDRARTVADVIGDLRKIGSKLDPRSVEMLLYALAQRGYAKIGGTDAKPTFVRAHVIEPEPKAARPAPAPTPEPAEPAQPVDPPTPNAPKSIDDLLEAIDESLIHMSVNITELRGAVKERPDVSQDEIQELRAKAAKLDVILGALR